MTSQPHIRYSPILPICESGWDTIIRLALSNRLDQKVTRVEHGRRRHGDFTIVSFCEGQKFDRLLPSVPADSRELETGGGS